MLIRLEFDGRTIHQIDAEKITAPVTIGRSRENVWPTPPDDARISGRHATVYREGKALYVKDEGSTNKTFYKTEALTKPLKLAVGMTLRLGACSLVVEEGDPAAGQPVIPAPVDAEINWQEIGRYCRLGAAASAPLIVAGTIWVILLLVFKH